MDIRAVDIRSRQEHFRRKFVVHVCKINDALSSNFNTFHPKIFGSKTVWAQWAIFFLFFPIFFQSPITSSDICGDRSPWKENRWNDVTFATTLENSLTCAKKCAWVEVKTIKNTFGELLVIASMICFLFSSLSSPYTAVASWGIAEITLFHQPIYE